MSSLLPSLTWKQIDLQWISNLKIILNVCEKNSVHQEKTTIETLHYYTQKLNAVLNNTNTPHESGKKWTAL